MLLVLLLLALTGVVNAGSDLYVGPFQSGIWLEDTTEASRNPRAIHVQERKQLSTKFIVALKHRDADSLKKEFLAVSMPQSGKYGKHLSASEIKAKYAPESKDLERIMAYLGEMEGAHVEVRDRLGLGLVLNRFSGHVSLLYIVI
jgi:subtilase family serine protease